MQTNLSEQPIELNSEEFVIGDMVVIHNYILGPLGSVSIFLISEIKSDSLGEHVSMHDTNGNIWTSAVRYLRHATISEVQAKRRLPLKGEVS